MCNLANVSPHEPLLLREVADIAKAHQAVLWDHTASLRSDIHNIMSKSQKSPKDLNPFRSTRARDEGRGMSIREAKKFFQENFS